MPATPPRSSVSSRLTPAGARVLPALLAVLGLTPASEAQELPSGGHSDCAVLTYEAGRLFITQGGPDCIINWESFSVGEGGLVEFFQSDSWRVLNRVTGEEFSTIAGTIRAPGTVYIVNPAGIFFTGSAVVDVGGIYAAASAITDEDFIAGVDRFVGPAGEVINEGTISGSAVHLLGRRVANHGSIHADGGVVTMVAAENEIFLSEGHDGRILVRVDDVDLTPDLAVSPGGVPPTLSGPAGVENTGSIEASGGNVVLGVGDIYSLAIRNTGSIDAAGGSAQLAAVSGTVLHGAGASMVAAELAMTGDVLYLDSDVNADDARFNDPVVVGSDVRVEGAVSGTSSASVVFASTVDSEDGERNDLEIDAVETTLQDHVGAAERLGRFDVSGRATVEGDVLADERVTFGDDVTLTRGGRQTIDAGAGSIVAHGAITKIGGGGLRLLASTTIDLDDDVLVTSPGDLTLTAALIDAEGSLTTAVGDVRVNGDADIEGSVSAGGDAVFSGIADIAGDVISGEDAVFQGAATIGGSVSAVEDVEFRSDASVNGDVTAGLDVDFLGVAGVGGSVAAGDDVTFVGSATVGGSVSGVDDVEFLSEAEVAGDVIAGEDVQFFSRATVGGRVAAGDDAEFFGAASVGGGVSAGDDVEFFTDAMIGGSVSAIGDITFLGEAVVAGGVAAGDDATFSRAASIGGDVTTGDDLSFLADASIGGGVTALGDLRFVGNATVGGSVTGGDDVDFLALANVGGGVWAADDAFFGDARIGGAVVAGDDVTFARSAEVAGAIAAGGDAEFVGVARIDGDVVAGDDVSFLSAATVGGDVTAGDDVTFEQRVTLSGFGDQRIAAAGDVRARGDVVKTTSGALTLEAGERLAFSGSLVSALDDIRLNPRGRSSIPVAATITSRNSLTISSRRGAVEMGRFEKLTVSGDLAVDAARWATLSDVNTLGDMIVTAPEIRLWTREAGHVLTETDGLTTDRGGDLVAGGRFFFSVAPTLLGAGPTPILGSSRVDADALGTLSGFRLRVVPSFTRSQLRSEAGTPLDLIADGSTASSLAEAFTDDPGAADDGEVSLAVTLTPELVATLRELGLSLRPLTRQELMDAAVASRVLNDLRRGVDSTESGQGVAVGRIERVIAKRGLESYRSLGLGPAAGDIADASAIRAAFGRAWDGYVAMAGEADGPGFRRYLESDETWSETLRYLDGLRDLFRDISIMGLSGSEIEVSRDRIFSAITPDRVGREQLEKAIG